jgi:dipeptidase D
MKEKEKKLNIEHQKTVEILNWFEQLNKIPRCSGNEEGVAQWLMAWAKDCHFEAARDLTGNVLINVPGTAGYEDSQPIIIQGHMDMVCEKTPDSPHDFSKDPIRFVYDCDWLKADQTTLGADNGIAIAMGMVAAIDKELKHPPLELLFTVDEETGLTGAFGLEQGFFKGKRLLNLDSELEGEFTVGCAGGLKSEHAVPLDLEAIPRGFEAFTIAAGGMSGGHSADIHHEKANALKIIARSLEALRAKVDLRIADLTGGSADNAIPRDAKAVIYMKETHVQTAQEIIAGILKTVSFEFKNTDLELSLILSKGSKDNYSQVLTPDCSQKINRLMLAIPHGIYAMSTEVEHFVETSNNFASMKIVEKEFHFVTSQRSPIESRLDDVTRHITAVVDLVGGSSKHRGRYPGWPADMESPLLALGVEVYEKLYGHKPVVLTTHGGLECGVIGNKFPGMDMLSFGPTIQEPHSPDERIHIGSIGKVWDFMTLLLAGLT